MLRQEPQEVSYLSVSESLHWGHSGYPWTIMKIQRLLLLLNQDHPGQNTGWGKGLGRDWWTPTPECTGRKVVPQTPPRFILGNLYSHLGIQGPFEQAWCIPWVPVWQGHRSSRRRALGWGGGRTCWLSQVLSMQERTKRTVWGASFNTRQICKHVLLSVSTICMASHNQRMEPVRPEGSTAIVETFISILVLRWGGSVGRVSERASEQKMMAHNGEAGVLGFPERNMDA